MPKSFKWNPDETREELIARLLSEEVVVEEESCAREETGMISVSGEDYKTLVENKSLEEIELDLNCGLSPVLHPEWGEELVKAIQQKKHANLSSLGIFLQHCPLSRGFWNSFKLIYKLLESRLIFLSNITEASILEEAEMQTIIRSMAIIFSRLEKKANCKDCPRFYRRIKWDHGTCKNPCETWKGGIRYTPQKISIYGETVDALAVRKKLIEHQGIRNAEVFKSRPITDNAAKEPGILSALLLVDDTFDRQEFESFLDPFSEDKTLPDVVHYFHISERSNPWNQRGASSPINTFYSAKRYTRELHADVRTFVYSAKPSGKTIGYMRRRFRRLLRDLQKNNSRIYVDLCLELFKRLGYPQRDNMATQWLLTEIVFGQDKALVQRGHGRGLMAFPTDYANRQDRREPCPEAWDNALQSIERLLVSGRCYLIVAEFLLRIWNEQREKIPVLGMTNLVLERYLQSSSRILSKFAFEQLAYEHTRIKELQPASVARGLVVLPTKDAENYFNIFFPTEEELVPSSWKRRFAYDFDDAIYSQQKESPSNGPNLKTLTLGLLAMRLAWSGRIKVKPDKIDSDKIFGWNSKYKPSIWNKGIWVKPNVSQTHNGLIGWPHAIFDRSFQDLLQKPEKIDLQKYLSLADPSRLLNLMNFKIMKSECFGYNSWQRGNDRFTTADLRLERCPNCEQDRQYHHWWQDESEIQPAPTWLKSEIIMALPNLLGRLDPKNPVVDRLKGLLMEEIKAGNPTALKSLSSHADLPSVYKDIAEGFLAIPQRNWKKDFAKGKLIPESLLRSSQFLSLLWDLLGNDQEREQRLLASKRFFKNPEVRTIILEHFIPEYLDQVSDEQVEVFWTLLDNKPDIFNLESKLLLKAATSSDARIHERALVHAKALGVNNGFALLLLESDFPRAVEEGTNYFCQLDPKTSTFPKDIVALCDSPHEVPRKLGLELLEKYRETVPYAQIMLQLKENRHPDIRHYLAAKLSDESDLFPNSLDFDVAVLRSRHTERNTKELVKSRLERQLPKHMEMKSLSKDFLEALKELSLGLVPKDREWAIKQLTDLKLGGLVIPEIRIQEIKDSDHGNSKNI